MSANWCAPCLSTVVLGMRDEGGKGRPNEISVRVNWSRTDRDVKAILGAGRLTGAVEAFKDKLVIRS